MRIFPHYRLLKLKNLRKFRRKIKKAYEDYSADLITYDAVYDFLEGWSAYAKNANTYKLRQIVLKDFEKQFVNEISTKEINRGTRKKKN